MSRGAAVQSHHTAATRDQRAHNSNNAHNQVEAATAGKARVLLAQSSQVMVGPSSSGSDSSSSSSSGAWIKGSTTFQITMVVVSVLMGSVILAFVLFCIVIYQIKPTSSNSTGGFLAASTGSSLPGTPLFQRQPQQRSALVNKNGTTSLTMVDQQQSLTTLPNHRVPNFIGQQRTANNFEFPVLSPTACSTYSPNNNNHQQQQQQESLYVSSQTTPLLAAICDPLTGQMPAHLIVRHPIGNSFQNSLSTTVETAESSLASWNGQASVMSSSTYHHHQPITTPTIQHSMGGYPPAQ